MAHKSKARINWISTDAVQILKRVVADANERVVVAEIGVGIGSTTKQFLRILSAVGGGDLHLFDRERIVDRLVDELQALPSSEGVEIVGHGNSPKLHASYAWELAKMVRERDQAGESAELFDFVYLDGAHAFQHDAAACAVLKRMIKPGGYLVLDDMRWTFEKSASMNPSVRPDTAETYTEEQLSVPHVRLVADVLLRRDPEFEEIHLTDEAEPKRGVFRRRSLPNHSPGRRRRGGILGRFLMREHG